MIAGAPERFYGPQRIAAGEAERSEHVGVGETLEVRAIETGPQPQIADAVVAGAAMLR